ncbi:MAG: SprT-like domain-containing protein [Nannocystaceae bacterium]
MASNPVASLSVELETKLLHRLLHEWEAINDTYFKDVLRRPLFRLSETRTRLGQWIASERTLELSRALVLERPWGEVLEVLKHEVVHQFVDERLAVDETPHGPTFRSICERLGIDGAASGVAKTTTDHQTTRTIDRIRKLLALAQSPNQNEAETAAITARRLMLKFNIEVDGVDPERSKRRHAYGFRHLGRPTGRVLEHARRLAAILTEYFFVEGLWIPVYRPLEGKRGSVFEICGLEANLMMAEHVHTFLTATAQRLWLDYRRATQRTSNRDRQAFLAGVMGGFEVKLAAQSERFQEQGLVWVPGAELHGYFRRRYPRVQTLRRGGAHRGEAFAEGKRAGHDIVLSKPVTGSATAGSSRPKALRRGRS